MYYYQPMFSLWPIIDATAYSNLYSASAERKEWKLVVLDLIRSHPEFESSKTEKGSIKIKREGLSIIHYFSQLDVVSQAGMQCTSAGVARNLCRLGVQSFTFRLFHEAIAQVEVGKIRKHTSLLAVSLMNVDRKISEQTSFRLREQGCRKDCSSGVLEPVTSLWEVWCRKHFCSLKESRMLSIRRVPR
jgi:hypothetical protein